MVTKFRSRARRYLFIAEWMHYRGISDEKLADRIGVDRVTVTRWRNQQNRLNPEKIAAIAKALDIEPEELWKPPPGPGPITRPSVDAILKDASDELVQRAAEVAAILLKTGT